MVRVKTFCNLTPVTPPGFLLLFLISYPFIGHSGTSGSPGSIPLLVLFPLLVALLPRPIFQDPSLMSLYPKQMQPLIFFILACVCCFSSLPGGFLRCRVFPAHFWTCCIGNPQMFAWNESREGPQRQTSYFAVFPRHLSQSVSEQPGTACGWPASRVRV